MYFLLENTSKFKEENRKLPLTPPPKEIQCNDIFPSCYFFLYINVNCLQKSKTSGILLLFLLTIMSEAFYILLRIFVMIVLNGNIKILNVCLQLSFDGTGRKDDHLFC